MASKYQGSEAEVATLSAYITLIRAAESVINSLGPLLAPHAITISQFGVLDALYHLGPMRQGKLAEKILRSSGNLTKVLDNLARRGLVERRRNTADRRCVIVRLSAEGKALFERILPAHVKSVAQRFSALSPEEQGVLRGLCRRLGTAEAVP